VGDAGRMVAEVVPGEAEHRPARECEVVLTATVVDESGGCGVDLHTVVLDRKAARRVREVEPVVPPSRDDGMLDSRSGQPMLLADPEQSELGA